MTGRMVSADAACEWDQKRSVPTDRIFDLAHTVVMQAQQIAALRSALERTEANFVSVVRGHPVRDMAENLAENASALGELS